MPQQTFGIQLFLVLGATIAACSSNPESSVTASGAATTADGANGTGETATSSGPTTTSDGVAATGSAVTTSSGISGTGEASTSGGPTTTGVGTTTTGSIGSTTSNGMATTGAVATTAGGTTGASTTGTTSSATGSGGAGAGGATGGTGMASTSGGSDDPLGPCSGTEDECEAARIINEYRAQHVFEGECSEPLQWSDKVGQLAHDHQVSQGLSIAHSDHGYPENVGMGYGLRETTEYIIQFEQGTEPHCNADGSFSMGHHCTAMLCSPRSIGIGIVRNGDQVAMTMMFGDENGDSGW